MLTELEFKQARNFGMVPIYTDEYSKPIQTSEHTLSVLSQALTSLHYHLKELVNEPTQDDKDQADSVLTALELLDGFQDLSYKGYCEHSKDAMTLILDVTSNAIEHITEHNYYSIRHLDYNCIESLKESFHALHKQTGYHLETERPSFNYYSLKRWKLTMEY